MAKIKVIYYNAKGLKEEHDAANDSIEMAQFETANHILTDTVLGTLINNQDASSLHNHDSSYFSQTEFISVYTPGPTGIGVPILTDGAGTIDNSFFDGAALAPLLDHGLLNASSLLDDDHTQYIINDGSRGAQAITGDLTVQTPVNSGSIANKSYVDAVAEGLKPKQAARVASTADIAGSFAASALTSTATALATNDIDGITVIVGDRVLLKDQTNAEENGIYEVTTLADGASQGLVLTRAVDMDSLTPIDEINGAYVPVQEGTANQGKFFVQSGVVSILDTDAISFVFFNAVAAGVSGGDGIDVTGGVISADLLSLGGLRIDANQLAVNTDEIDGEGLIANGLELDIDWSTAFNDAKAVKAEDLNSTVNGEGASIIGVEDSAGNFTSGDVEGVLLELHGLAVAGGGVSYIAGETIAAGDLVYVSANDNISVYSDLTADEFVVGMALEAGSALDVIKVARFDKVLTGVLTGATAGAEYYWTGSAFSNTAPSGGNNNVYLAGIAKNATDLSVEVRHLFKKV